MNVVSRESFLDAMAILPGSVAIVTTGRDGERAGLTVSALCSLSADPPSIIACINKTASAHDRLIANGCFAANVLRPDQQSLAKLFTAKGIDRFSHEDWSDLATGAPVLSSALIVLDCKLHQMVDAFTHSILIGVVVGLHLSEDAGQECLIWHRRKFRVPADLISS